MTQPSRAASGLPSPSYFIIDGSARSRETYIDWERAAQADVLDDLKTGQAERPIAVWELNATDGTLRNVSEDFAQAVVSGVMNGTDSYPTGGLLDFCEDWLGCEALAELAHAVGHSEDNPT